VFTSIR